MVDFQERRGRAERFKASNPRRTRPGLERSYEILSSHLLCRLNLLCRLKRLNDLARDTAVRKWWKFRHYVASKSNRIYCHSLVFIYREWTRYIQCWPFLWPLRDFVYSQHSHQLAHFWMALQVQHINSRKLRILTNVPKISIRLHESFSREPVQKPNRLRRTYHSDH